MRAVFYFSGVRDGRARGCYGVPTREHEERNRSVQGRSYRMSTATIVERPT
jgi:hypothetical protein